MDCSPPGSSALGIFQARALEWVVIDFSMINFMENQTSPQYPWKYKYTLLPLFYILDIVANNDKAKALLPQEDRVGGISQALAKNLNKTVVHGNSTLAGSYKSGTITPLSKLLFLTHIFRKGE